MALITCPECGRKNVSDMAEACPSCGYPINESSVEIDDPVYIPDISSSINDDKVRENKKIETKGLSTKAYGYIIAGTAVFLILLISVSSKPKSSSKPLYLDSSHNKGYSTVNSRYYSDYSYTTKDSALSQAQSYLKSGHFSRQGLIEQLEYEGFSTSEATSATDKSGADWNAESLETANSYLKTGDFSFKGLQEQLEYEGFTDSEINYAMSRCNADWDEEAYESARSYMSHNDFTRSELFDQLEYEGFTHSQIEQAVNKVF